MNRHPCIGDVARAAEVDRTTASVVLNGRGKQLRISPATQARVLAVARQLGVASRANGSPQGTPQQAAGQGMARLPVGLVITQASSAETLSLIARLELEFSAAGYPLVIITVPADAEGIRGRLLERRVSGLLSCRSVYSAVSAFRSGTCPVIVVWEGAAKALLALLGAPPSEAPVTPAPAPAPERSPSPAPAPASAPVSVPAPVAPTPVVRIPPQAVPSPGPAQPVPAAPPAQPLPRSEPVAAKPVPPPAPVAAPVPPTAPAPAPAIPVVIPIPDQAPQPDPEPTSAPVSVADPVATPEPVPVVEQSPVSEPVTASDPEPVIEPVVVSVPAPVAAPQPEPAAKAAEAVPEPVSDPAPEVIPATEATPSQPAGSEPEQPQNPSFEEQGSLSQNQEIPNAN